VDFGAIFDTCRITYLMFGVGVLYMTTVGIRLIPDRSGCRGPYIDFRDGRLSDRHNPAAGATISRTFIEGLAACA
jgi:hypothetical protein